MRFGFLIVTLIVLCIPSQVTAAEKKARVNRSPQRALTLKALMVPSPFEPEEYRHELAVPPSDYDRKEEPRPLFIQDVEFIKRSETRHIYGQ